MFFLSLISNWGTVFRGGANAHCFKIQVENEKYINAHIYKVYNLFMSGKTEMLYFMYLDVKRFSRRLIFCDH